MKGGPRPGSGRPKAEPTQPVSIRLTQAQHAAYIERGGARWIKRLLSETTKPQKAAKGSTTIVSPASTPPWWRQLHASAPPT